MLNMDTMKWSVLGLNSGKGGKHGHRICPPGNRGKEYRPRRASLQGSGNGSF
jgi:hypothetical protein